MGIHQMLLMKGQPASKKPGFTPKYDGFGTILHGNADSAYADYVFGSAYDIGPLAGIEGYLGETITWNLTWAPLYSDPSPSLSLSPDVAGRFEIIWGGANSSEKYPGLLTLQVVVNGVPCPDKLQISAAEGGYASVAWGPAP